LGGIDILRAAAQRSPATSFDPWNPPASELRTHELSPSIHLPRPPRFPTLEGVSEHKNSL